MVVMKTETIIPPFFVKYKFQIMLNHKTTPPDFKWEKKMPNKSISTFEQ